jgi:soluble lytic murein transglycosylase-like protein
MRVSYCLISSVIVQLALLGMVSYTPEPAVPLIAVRPATEQNMKDELKLEKYNRTVTQAMLVSDRLYHRHGCDSQYTRTTAERAVIEQVNVRLVTAVVIVESSCKFNAHSARGAHGLMQIVPKIHHVSAKALQDPNTNIQIGTRYLALLVHKYGVREGIHHYFGMGNNDGSTDGNTYTNHVLLVAGYQVN